jgi:hypothetical protein
MSIEQTRDEMPHTLLSLNSRPGHNATGPGPTREEAGDASTLAQVKVAPDLQDRIKQAVGLSDRFTSEHQQYRRLYWLAYSTVITAALAGTTAIAWLSALDRGRDVIVAGAIVAFLMGLHTAFRYDSKARFHRIVAVESSSIGLLLKLSVHDESSFQRLLRQFSALKKFAAKSTPRDRGVEALRELFSNTSGERRPASRPISRAKAGRTT